jgi:hypothetical protein
MGWQRRSCRCGLGLRVSRRAGLALSKAIFIYQTGLQPLNYLRQQLSNQ